VTAINVPSKIVLTVFIVFSQGPGPIGTELRKRAWLDCQQRVIFPSNVMVVAFSPAASYTYKGMRS
jgi:hypothetical protein